MDRIRTMLQNPMVAKSIHVLFIRGLGMLLFFGLTLFLTNRFDAGVVGQYDFSRALLIFLGGVCVFGMHQSVIYYSGFLKAKQSLRYLKSVYRKMLVILLSIAFVFFLVAVSTPSESIDALFDKPVAKLVLYSVCALAFYGLTLLNIDVFRAIDKIYISEIYRNIIRYALFFAAIIWLYYTDNPLFLVEAFLLNFAFLGLASTVYLFFYFSKVSSADSPVTISYKAIMRRSGPMAISAITYLLMQSVDVILLSKFNSFDEVAYYSVAIKLTTIISLVLASVNAVYGPSFSEWWNLQDFDRLKEGIRKSTRLIFALTFPAIAIVFLFANFILNLFGEAYTVAKTALWFLLIGQAVNALCGSVGVYMNMTGKQVVFQRILLTAFAINITLNLLLIPRYGIVGAAVATTISTVFWNLFTTGYIYKKDRITTFLTLR